MQTDTQELFDLKASCRRLGNWSEWTMRKQIAKGNVAVIRIGKRIFLNGAEIARIAKEGLPSLSQGAPR